MDEWERERKREGAGGDEERTLTVVE